jgi:hypothetical protein
MNVIWDDSAAINREAVLVRHTDPVCDERFSQRRAKDSRPSSRSKNHMMIQFETCMRSGKRDWPICTKAKDWRQRPLRIPMMFGLTLDVPLDSAYTYAADAPCEISASPNRGLKPELRHSCSGRIGLNGLNYFGDGISRAQAHEDPKVISENLTFKQVKVVTLTNFIDRTGQQIHTIRIRKDRPKATSSKT